MTGMIPPMAVEPTDPPITCVWKVMCDYQSYTSAEIAEKLADTRYSASTILHAVRRLRICKDYLVTERHKENGRSVIRYSLRGGKGFPRHDPAKLLAQSNQGA